MYLRGRHVLDLFIIFLLRGRHVYYLYHNFIIFLLRGRHVLDLGREDDVGVRQPGVVLGSGSFFSLCRLLFLFLFSFIYSYINNSCIFCISHCYCFLLFMLFLRFISVVVLCYIFVYLSLFLGSGSACGPARFLRGNWNTGFLDCILLYVPGDFRRFP